MHGTEVLNWFQWGWCIHWQHHLLKRSIIINKICGMGTLKFIFTLIILNIFIWPDNLILLYLAH